MNCSVFLCVNWSSISNETSLLSAQNLYFLISYTRQEHTETQMLRKRVKDLETEYKQLQLEYQVKEGRVIDLESDVEVSIYSIWEWTYELSVCEFEVVQYLVAFGLVV